MIKQTVKEHIVILMEQRMKVIGLTISNMGKATKSGLMDLNMLEIMLRVRKLGRENLPGKMGRIMREISTTTLKGLELTPGQTIESMLENGNRTKCMVREFLLGRMGDDLRVHM